MNLDSHIHMRPVENNNYPAARASLKKSFSKAGISGGLIISPGPDSNFSGGGVAPEIRLEQVIRLCEGDCDLFPCFWLDPTAPDATSQVDAAVKAGIDAFKVICSGFYPSDERAMKTYARIAEARRPLLFHSGILWDGHASAKYNRPAEFECMLDIEGIKFAIAHISWPWCDECVAVFGKFLNSRLHNSDCATEMFIDTTPGTPELYRRDSLQKLFTVGYDVGNNVMFGSDCDTNEYNEKWTIDWMARDRELLNGFGVSKDIQEHVFSLNLLRFLGKSDEVVTHELPDVAK